MRKLFADGTHDDDLIGLALGSINFFFGGIIGLMGYAWFGSLQMTIGTLCWALALPGIFRAMKGK